MPKSVEEAFTKAVDERQKKPVGLLEVAEQNESKVPEYLATVEA